ncbi:hypothetical protein EV1_004432 [Malus domestica]
MLERLEKKLWIHTVNTLVRKLSSDKKVGIAALFFHKLVDNDQNVDRVTLADTDDLTSIVSLISPPSPFSRRSLGQFRLQGPQ